MFCRTDELRGKAQTVAPAQSQLLQLMADAAAKGIVMRDDLPYGDDADGDASVRPSKRRRVSFAPASGALPAYKESFKRSQGS